MRDASHDIASRCAPIRLLVLDVDGVLTDGVIAIDDRGVETKNFHVRDGTAVALWRKSGRRVAILSGRKADCVDRRAAELGISPVIQGASDKGPPFEGLLRELEVEPAHTCYIGDDLADLSVISKVGLAACPSDAAAEVRDAVHLVAAQPGGRGAVREIVETILKNQGVWEELIASFRPPGRSVGNR